MIKSFTSLVLTITTLSVLTGCASSAPSVTEVSKVIVSTPSAEASKISSIDLTAIPIGDSKIVTNAPTEKGYLYVCNIVTGGGGGFSSPWAGTETWDSTKKAKVDGDNIFTNAVNSFTSSNDTRLISTNGIPSKSYAGNFPVQSTDDAYNYDRNPNSIIEQNISINVPLNPTVADEPSCTNMGAIGYSINGVAIFNATDAENRDAVAHEVQDSCDGHPEKSGTYHYHNGSACLVDDVANGASKLIGYALDGFGIYAEKDNEGNLKTNADLDACHGHISEVEWNGSVQSIYHYSATLEFPYTVGCFMGTPVKISVQNNSQPTNQRPPLNVQQPPPLKRP